MIILKIQVVNQQIFHDIDFIIQLHKWTYAYLLVIPLGLVRDTHFSLRVPKYLNVGSLGLTLAHEMLHSLDTTGRQFDHRGRLTSDFWDSRSRKNFANVSECVVKQYQNHFKRPLRIDSRTIMLEVMKKRNLLFRGCSSVLDFYALVFKKLHIQWIFIRLMETLR